MTTNAVDHPAHYVAHYSREVIELTSRMDFCAGNAVKYVLRSRYKGRLVEDLEKARWYVTYLINHPAAGRLQDGWELTDAAEDFVDDLIAAPDRTFAWPAALFLRSFFCALRLPVEERAAALKNALVHLDAMMSAASI